MKKFILTALLAASLAPSGAVASGPIYPDDWRTCTSNDDCVKVYGCEDVAVNQDSVKTFKQAFNSCDATKVSDPKLVAKCINGTCALDLAQEWK